MLKTKLIQLEFFIFSSFSLLDAALRINQGSVKAVAKRSSYSLDEILIYRFFAS